MQESAKIIAHQGFITVFDDFGEKKRKIGRDIAVEFCCKSNCVD
jgi:hypothetical protein